ncbi:Asp-tRNA(Asn)/Glu-tRNA(Gln) amidotransferase GatCAB subunit A [Candidatus Kaiserbacteria bacterium CG10_big_fil_rev_8_21_14_0_10_45_20]|uniref:Glutamyl-tRNA(Gln) amidotransferase subunit A n=1 Tax=Candidatus Kaiserbacteria bacterium CG10_big_fil_rev_8_21_14_0_10_45_20 TaxID=1974607 RepID=A0A2H0UFR0_9BACT|nr:MAG: Asp-tRNA(Asn)/Glu-tRNA(Gln) amidotransferase GatCAB subunit A [Candidatus Kaiserbacteria bacterium CG10_big_fil_rev_8_21_14_0_10_45_20]
MEYTDLSVRELQQGYRAKDFSVSEVVRAYLDKIEKENPTLNAYLEVFDGAFEYAKEADALFLEKGDRAPSLTGIPVAVKDNILIKGRIASSASKMLENHVAPYDATVIKKLREENALCIGRTNMDEFAMGSSTEHSAFGPTRNPHDPERVPGGSSGGSASAVAGKMAPVALGSETCGSIRQPASLCGLVGFKPTYGAVSRSGLIAMGSSLDQIGPLSRTVNDAELVFNIIRGYDELDATSLPAYEPVSAKNKRIGVPRAFIKDASPEVQQLFEGNLKKLEKEGYEIVDIEFPSAPYALAAYYIVMPAEVSTNLARLDGVRYGHHAPGEDLLDEYKKSRMEGFGKETRRRIILGTHILSSGYYDAYYARATALRGALAKDLEKAFESVSYIATPTTPNVAFKLGEKADPLSMYLEDVFAAPANLTGIPAISVSAGTIATDGKDLPIGIQFMSPKRSDKSLFDVARTLLGETNT